MNMVTFVGDGIEKAERQEKNEALIGMIMTTGVVEKTILIQTTSRIDVL